MKNLKLHSEISQNLELQSQQEALLFSAFDFERNRLFFASSNNFIYTADLSSFQVCALSLLLYTLHPPTKQIYEISLYLFHQNGKSKSLLLASSVINQIELEDGDLITAFDYLLEKEALIIGTENGLLLLHNVDHNSTEIVGQVNGGVKCISPSPDGDLLAILTGFRQMLVMTHDWDLLHETAVGDGDGAGLDVSKDLSLLLLLAIFIFQYAFVVVLLIVFCKI